MGIVTDIELAAVSSTELVRNLSKYIDELVDGKKSRLVVMRNNKPDAVLISVEEMKRIEALIEGVNKKKAG